MAAYDLLASETTVQVISPTLVNDVVYCTIRTHASGVVCSKPINSVFFDAGTAGTLLNEFANTVETVMAFPEVIAGVGSQTIDNNGLIADQVTFTVEYIPPGGSAGAVTATVDIPVTQLDFSQASSAAANEAAVNTAINDAVANLKAASAG